MTGSIENPMFKDAKIYVAGHRGLAGSAILRRLLFHGHRHVITRTHAELDLMNPVATKKFFENERPDFVLLAAAKVGGIHANQTYPAEFIYQNLMIQNHIIHHSYLNGVKRLIFLGSSCSYPKRSPQPITEEQLLCGALEPTNSAYAVAKIAGMQMCWAYNRQYGTRFLPVMPTNLYGPRDNFDLRNSHVLPAIIRKIHLGKMALHRDWPAISRDETAFGPIPDEMKRSLGIDPRGNGPVDGAQPRVVLWGTGRPRRELLYSDDLADACLFLLFKPWEEMAMAFEGRENMMFNIGTGRESTIRDLAIRIAEAIGYEGPLLWDESMPDGTPCKLLDHSRLNNFGWRPQSDLADGIRRTYRWYLDQTEKG